MKLILSIFISVFVLCMPLFSQTFSPDQRILQNAPYTEQLDAETFIFTALVASGVEEQKIADYQKKLNSIASEFLSMKNNFATEEETAEKALLFLYEKTLSDYSTFQTRIDILLDSGKYNCVSSSVIFMYIMKKAGIECYGNETPNHAFCTIQAGEKLIDVETTNPYGFNPGKKRSTGNSNRYYVVPARNYNNRKRINDRRLVSLIYNNRISELQRKKQSIDAIDLSISAWCLQNESQESLRLVEITGANVIAELSDKKRNEESLDFAKNFSKKFKLSQECLQNTAAAAGRVLNMYTTQKKFEEAEIFLQGQKSILSNKDYQNLYSVLIQNSLTFTAENNDFNTAAEIIRSRQSEISEKDYQRILGYAYSRQAELISKTEGFLEAWKFISEGIKELPKNQDLKRQMNVYSRNYAAKIHNEAAALYNSGKIEEAKELVQNALNQIGSSRILENDLKKF